MLRREASLALCSARPNPLAKQSDPEGPLDQRRAAPLPDQASTRSEADYKSEGRAAQNLRAVLLQKLYVLWQARDISD